VETLPQALLSDRGLAYGQGLFETIRVQHGRAPLAADHRQRMLRGAQQLGLPLTPAQFDQALAHGLARAGDALSVIKLVLTAGSGGRGYASPAHPRVSLSAAVFPYSPRPALQYQQGMVVGVCKTRLADAGALAGLKHLARLEQVLAADEVRAHGWDEGMVLDARQRPLELTSMNLFARFGDRLWTPALDRAGVNGVMRQRILASGLSGTGVELCRRPRVLADLRHADEIFACNAVAGVLPVRKLALWHWPVGDLTRRLQSTVENWFLSP
jgi:4-amino-4-deoxychorismate lyase